MQDQYVLLGRGFKNILAWGKATGFEFQIRIPYYRGVFLSLVHELSVEVNGQAVATDDIEVGVGGRYFSIAEMTEADDVRWGYGESAIVRVRRPGGLNPGAHQIRLSILIRKSYTPPEDPEHLLDFAWRDGKYFPFMEAPTVVSRTMTIVQ